ncbi:MAG: hypothetical protein ABH862_01505 [Candidatus Omnitrophota bacterium]
MVIKRILKELKDHAPFTFFGALTGVLLMIFFWNIPERTAYNFFYVFHPMHVLLSALVTASMYKNYKCATDNKKCSKLAILFIGLTGSIGIATISDSVIPYLGEILLRMPNAHPHIGFIEEWQVIIPLALAGTIIAYFWPRTKIPHAGHVLISTWASLFHIIMAKGSSLGIGAAAAIFVFLFLAVWAPCCISDIVYPLIFIREGENGDLQKENTCH